MSNNALDDDKEVLDEKQGSIIMGLIAQLRKGSDLHRVTLPTFVLEPRSFLERASDFMSHPELIIGTSIKPDSLTRFVDVVRYFMSGWHIRPKGVKKPYNPVLGELFKCKHAFADGTESFFVAEQVSHHPPISTYLYASPENNLVIQGDVRPTSKFLGNSAATLMGGGTKISFTNIPGEEYTLNLPNIYARGILFGTMFMELGDSVVIKCPKNDLICEIDFKVKGFFSGTYNSISGKIKSISTNEVFYTLSGKWSDIIYIQKPTWPNKELLLDVSKSEVHPKILVEESQMNEFESRRLWSKVTKAMQERNLDLATDEKSLIEDNQRTIVKDRTDKGIKWESQYFKAENNGQDWCFKYPIPSDPAKAKQEYQRIIFGEPTLDIHKKFWAESISKLNSDADGDVFY